MTDKQIISQQQRSLAQYEKALSESRRLILDALDDLEKGGTNSAKHRLANYKRKVLAHD